MDIYNKAYSLLKAKEDFILVTILKKSGSISIEQGTNIIIKKDLSIISNVNINSLELILINLSSNIFESKKSLIYKYKLPNDKSYYLSSKCYKCVNLLLEYIHHSDFESLNLYTKIMELNKKSINYVIVTKILNSASSTLSLQKWICTETTFYGKEDDKVQHVFGKIQENFNHMIMSNIFLLEDKYIIEPILNNECVYILGAGYISQKISCMTKMLDFRTIVVDTSSKFANKERFKTADEIKVVPNFENIFNHIKVDMNSYIIIITREHTYDKEVLSKMLKTNAKYIGMVGSKKKKDFIFSCLINEGYALKDLARVHNPIGISIHAETPEEIAVSIAAELIRVKKQYFKNINSNM